MDNSKAFKFIFGILGAVAGGVVGTLLFSLLIRQGLYAIAMPGALIGLGCGFASRTKSWALGIVCAVASLILGFGLEWKFRPFLVDDSLSYFVRHIGDLKTSSLALIAIGGVFGFWFGVGRQRRQPHANG